MSISSPACCHRDNKPEFVRFIPPANHLPFCLIRRKSYNSSRSARRQKLGEMDGDPGGVACPLPAAGEQQAVEAAQHPLVHEPAPVLVEMRMTAEQRKLERQRVQAAVAADPNAGPTALAERIWWVTISLLAPRSASLIILGPSRSHR